MFFICKNKSNKSKSQPHNVEISFRDMDTNVTFLIGTQYSEAILKYNSLHIFSEDVICMYCPYKVNILGCQDSINFI